MVVCIRLKESCIMAIIGLAEKVVVQVPSGGRVAYRGGAAQAVMASLGV
jgi:hypothetical protein